MTNNITIYTVLTVQNRQKDDCDHYNNCYFYFLMYNVQNTPLSSWRSSMSGINSELP